MASQHLLGRLCCMGWFAIGFTSQLLPPPPPNWVLILLALEGWKAAVPWLLMGQGHSALGAILSGDVTTEPQIPKITSLQNITE